MYIRKLVKMKPYPVVIREETLSVSNQQKEEHVALEETRISPDICFPSSDSLGRELATQCKLRDSEVESLLLYSVAFMVFAI